MEFENLQIEIPVGEGESNRNENPLNPLWEKKYHNQAKGFVVGLDVNSKEAMQKKSTRAKRFGLKAKIDEEAEHKDPFLEIEVNKIKFPPVTDAAFADDKPEALHLFGVNNMSTKDVFAYFKDHGPDTMEWIDDASCNVIWETEKMATNALKAMSRTYEELKDLNKEINDNDDLDVSEAEEEEREIWRIGLPNKKSEALFLRRATVEDKKLPGAATRSLYYLTHGRGRGNRGKPGIVSSSRKRKLQQATAFVKENLTSKAPEVQFVDVKEKDKEEDMDVDSDDEFVPSKKSKDTIVNRPVVRMGMYSDGIGKRPTFSEQIRAEENLKIEVRNSRKWSSGRRNHFKRDGSSSEESFSEDDSSDDNEVTKRDQFMRKDTQDISQRLGDDSDLRQQLDSSDLRAKIDNRNAQKKDVPDLRAKLLQKKKYLGLTKDQLNLCIEVTEVSDED
eukprot:Seg666.4 transcript_id=Seg666.4/GoldUCD/mRNA.D3Y31 product="Nuclear cap-binding protein subunit 3" protein_id=Seg666.4/GoldUCD/D3Y31